MSKVKRCCGCGEFKSVDCFTKNNKSKDGLDYRCKTCLSVHNREYRHSKDGILTTMYHRQSTLSSKRGHSPPKYTKDEFCEWMLANPKFNKLYNNWVASGYSRGSSPSVDRLDDYKGYSFNNIRLVTWMENNKKSHYDMLNGFNNKQSKAVLQYDKQGNFIKEYYSIAQASREHKLAVSDISSVCKGKNKTAHGYIWKYK